MGSGLIPFFANLFLFYDEWKCINKLKKKNVICYILSRKFCQKFRFRDNIRNIYPAELELTKKSKLIKTLTF